jgi:hypothetical protein
VLLDASSEGGPAFLKNHAPRDLSSIELNPPIEGVSIARINLEVHVFVTLGERVYEPAVRSPLRRG